MGSWDGGGTGATVKMTDIQIYEALQAGRSIRSISEEAEVSKNRIWRLKSKLQSLGMATVIAEETQAAIPEPSPQSEVVPAQAPLPSFRIQTAQELYQEITEVKSRILEEIDAALDAHDQRGIVAMVGCYTQTCKLMLDIASTQQAIESQRDTSIPDAIRDLIDELAL